MNLFTNAQLWIQRSINAIDWLSPASDLLIRRIMRFSEVSPVIKTNIYVRIIRRKSQLSQGLMFLPILSTYLKRINHHEKHDC